MGYEYAKLKPEGKSEFNVKFNPSEYNISKSVSYTDKKVLGLESPFIQFISGEAERLKMTLMFDTYQPPIVLVESNTLSEESGTDVRKETKKVTDLMNIDPSKHRPPLVRFQYGSLIFDGVIVEANQTFTMFLGNGTPVRARVEVTFQAVNNDQKVPLESPDRTKSRTIHEFQQVWNLAWDEYGDPDMWKVIARENKIMNPLDIEPGQDLKLPAL